jgi:hypothetical protein
MKLAYNSWHKENVSDQTAQQELGNITNGALSTSASIFTYKEKEEFKTSSGRKAFVTKNANARNSNNGKNSHGKNTAHNNNQNSNKKKY